jgi:hypothetical protein
MNDGVNQFDRIDGDTDAALIQSFRLLGGSRTFVKPNGVEVIVDPLAKSAGDSTQDRYRIFVACEGIVDASFQDDYDVNHDSRGVVEVLFDPDSDPGPDVDPEFEIVRVFDTPRSTPSTLEAFWPFDLVVPVDVAAQVDTVTGVGALAACTGTPQGGTPLAIVMHYRFNGDTTADWPNFGELRVVTPDRNLNILTFQGDEMHEIAFSNELGTGVNGPVVWTSGLATRTAIRRSLDSTESVASIWPFRERLTIVPPAPGFSGVFADPEIVGLAITQDTVGGSPKEVAYYAIGPDEAAYDDDVGQVVRLAHTPPASSGSTPITTAGYETSYSAMLPVPLETTTSLMDQGIFDLEAAPADIEAIDRSPIDGEPGVVVTLPAVGKLVIIQRTNTDSVDPLRAVEIPTAGLDEPLGLATF